MFLYSIYSPTYRINVMTDRKNVIERLYKMIEKHFQRTVIDIIII